MWKLTARPSSTPEGAPGGPVVLAGFLTITGDNFVEAFRNRILNVHPALLPSFGGKGYYGLHVHEAA